MERVLDRRGVRHVAPGHGPEARELDRDARLLAFVGEAFEGADCVRLHEDPVVLRLDVDLRLLRDLLDRVGEVVLRGPEGRARDRAFEPAAEDLDAGRGGDGRDGIEALLRVADLVERLRLQEGLHLRGAWLPGRPEHDRVAFRQAALVEDRVDGRPQALFLLDLEDRADRGPFRRGELGFQEPLRQADECEEEVGDSLAELRAHRHDGDVRREVGDTVVSLRRESMFEEAADQLVHALVELVPDGLRLVPIGDDEGLALMLPPSGHEVDLVGRDDERRLVPFQDVQALDRLRPEPLVDVDDEDREIREGSAAGPQGREGDVAGRVDEQEAGDSKRLALHQVAAHLQDRRKRDLRGADMLGDASGLAARDAGPADPVEQRGLPVVHVPEDGDDGLADGGGHTPRIKNPTLLEGSSLGSVVVRDRATPLFFRMVVEAEEDPVRVLDVDDAVAAPANPNILLHELPEFRILFQFRDRRSIDPELLRRREDAELLEPLHRLRHALDTDLEVVQRLPHDVGSPEGIALRVPIELQPLAGMPILEQDVRALVVPAAVVLSVVTCVSSVGVFMALMEIRPAF